MFNIVDIVDRIYSTTGITTGIGVDNETEQVNVENLPQIFVNYGETRNTATVEELGNEVLAAQGENIIQFVQVKIIASQSEFPSVWRTVFNALIGWHPEVNAANYSGLVYFQGVPRTYTIDVIVYTDIWALQFPVSVPLV